jgi:type IV secretion system protein VirB9
MGAASRQSPIAQKCLRSTAAFLLATTLLVTGNLYPVPAYAAVPITTDSRIKTFVFNENEVYEIVTHYGYQSNIEFGQNEEIVTVSVGDRVGWQIVPAGKRIFIRAMEEKAHTNMTVVTNKRAYQFDIREAGVSPQLASEELVYVVRFYYPDEPGQKPPPPPVSASEFSNFAPAAGGPVAPISSLAKPEPIIAAPLAAPSPAPASTSMPPVASSFAPTRTASLAPLPSAPASNFAPAGASSGFTPTGFAPSGPINYNYTYAGPADRAPVKIYDDGQRTYFKFREPGIRPTIAMATATGSEVPVETVINAEGVAVVNAVASRFSINNGGARITVFNEARASGV